MVGVASLPNGKSYVRSCKSDFLNNIHLHKVALCYQRFAPDAIEILCTLK